MCNDRPGDILYDTIRRNTIVNNPFKESIIGTVEEVNSITKKMLLNCYNTFYHPGNMFLVVTGNFDVDEMLKKIVDNQNSKEFKKFIEPNVKKYNEPDNVYKEYEVVKCNTNIPKVAYNIKINVSKFNMDVRKLSIYMYIIFNLLFGDTSNFDEELKSKGIITNTLYYNLLNIDSHFIITLNNATEKYEELVDNIESNLKNISFKENDLDRKKRVLISNEIFSYENIEMVNDMIVDSIIFDGKIETDTIDIINSLNINEINDIVKKIDFSKKSIVILKK